MARNPSAVPLPPSPIPPAILNDWEAARAHEAALSKAVEAAHTRVLEIETQLRSRLLAGEQAPAGWVVRIVETVRRSVRPAWKEVAMSLAEKADMNREAFEAWVRDHTPPSESRSSELEIKRTS